MSTYLFVLGVYLPSLAFVMLFLGINWNKFTIRYKYSIHSLFALIFILNFLFMQYVLDTILLVQVVINIVLVAAIFMGNQILCIGLTGGIATGKSTVANILTENGFEVIDSDKIAKEVSYNGTVDHDVADGH